MKLEEYLEGLVKFTDTPSLDSMFNIMKEFNNPQDRLKIIHIAGTNGKGSTCRMLSNILICAGYRVGTYVSPSILEFNDEININNSYADKFQIDELFKKLLPKIEAYNKNHKISVTYFEVKTMLALLYFEDKNCDFVILETGMGGRFDATNIVKPLISIITTIDYDHMAVLGKTIEEIAYAKVGIIKECSNTVFFEQKNVEDILKKECDKNKNILHIIKKIYIRNYSCNAEYQIFDYKELKNIEINLKGKAQIKNASLCLKAIEILQNKGFDIEEKHIRQGLKTVIHKARFEKIHDNPLMIFDGAHNISAIDNLTDTINTYYNKENKIFIISILNTKDYKSILKKLSVFTKAKFFLTDGIKEREYISKEELYNEAEKYLPKENLYKKSLDDALGNALESEEVITFVIGSFYVYKDVMKYINQAI